MNFNRESRIGGGLSYNRSASSSGVLPLIAKGPSFITTNDVRPAGLQSTQQRKGSMFSSTDSLRSMGPPVSTGPQLMLAGGPNTYNYKTSKRSVHQSRPDRFKRSQENYQTFENWKSRVDLAQLRLQQQQQKQQQQTFDMEQTAFFSPQKKRTHGGTNQVTQPNTQGYSNHEKRLYTSPKAADSRFIQRFTSGNRHRNPDHGADRGDGGDQETKQRQAYQERMKLENALRNEQIKLKKELELINSENKDLQVVTSASTSAAAHTSRHKETPSKKMPENRSMLFPVSQPNGPSHLNGGGNGHQNQRYMSPPIYGADSTESGAYKNDSFDIDEKSRDNQGHHQELPTTESRLIYGGASRVPSTDDDEDDSKPPPTGIVSRHHQYYQQQQRQNPMMRNGDDQLVGQNRERPQSIHSDSKLATGAKKRYGGAAAAAAANSKDDLIVELMSPGLQSEKQRQHGHFKSDNKSGIDAQNKDREQGFDSRQAVQYQKVALMTGQYVTTTPQTKVAKGSTQGQKKINSVDNMLGKKSCPNPGKSNSNQQMGQLKMATQLLGRNDNNVGDRQFFFPQLVSRKDSTESSNRHGGDYNGSSRQEMVVSHQSMMMHLQQLPSSDSKGYKSCRSLINNVDSRHQVLPEKQVSSNSGNMHFGDVGKEPPQQVANVDRPSGLFGDMITNKNNGDSIARSTTIQEKVSSHKGQIGGKIVAAIAGKNLVVQQPLAAKSVSVQNSAVSKNENSCNKICFKALSGEDDDTPLRSSNQRDLEPVKEKLNPKDDDNEIVIEIPVVHRENSENKVPPRARKKAPKAAPIGQLLSPEQPLRKGAGACQASPTPTPPRQHNKDSMNGPPTQQVTSDDDDLGVNDPINKATDTNKDDRMQRTINTKDRVVELSQENADGDQELQSEAHLIFPTNPKVDHHIPTQAEIQRMIQLEVQNQIINRDQADNTSNARKAQTPACQLAGDRRRLLEQRGRTGCNNSTVSQNSMRNSRKQLLADHQFAFQRNQEDATKNAASAECKNCLENNDKSSQPSPQQLQIFQLPDGQLLTTKDPKHFIKLTKLAGLPVEQVVGVPQEKKSNVQAAAAAADISAHQEVSDFINQEQPSSALIHLLDNTSNLYKSVTNQKEDANYKEHQRQEGVVQGSSQNFYTQSDLKPSHHHMDQTNDLYSTSRVQQQQQQQPTAAGQQQQPPSESCQDFSLAPSINNEDRGGCGSGYTREQTAEFLSQPYGTPQYQHEDHLSYNYGHPQQQQQQQRNPSPPSLASRQSATFQAHPQMLYATSQSTTRHHHQAQQLMHSSGQNPVDFMMSPQITDQRPTQSALDFQLESQQQTLIQPIITQIDAQGNIRQLRDLPEHIQKELVQMQLNQRHHHHQVESEESAASAQTSSQEDSLEVEPEEQEQRQRHNKQAKRKHRSMKKGGAKTEKSDRDDYNSSKTDSKQDYQFQSKQQLAKMNLKYSSETDLLYEHNNRNKNGFDGKAGGTLSSSQDSRAVAVGVTNSSHQQLLSEEQESKSSLLHKQQSQPSFRPREMTFATNSSPQQPQLQRNQCSKSVASADSFNPQQLAMMIEEPPKTPPGTEEAGLREPTELSPGKLSRQSPLGQQYQNEFPFVREGEPINNIQIPPEGDSEEGSFDQAPRVDKAIELTELLIKIEIDEMDSFLREGPKAGSKTDDDDGSPEESSSSSDDSVAQLQPSTTQAQPKPKESPAAIAKDDKSVETVTEKKEAKDPVVYRGEMQVESTSEEPSVDEVSVSAQRAPRQNRRNSSPKNATAPAALSPSRSVRSSRDLPQKSFQTNQSGCSSNDERKTTNAAALNINSAQKKKPPALINSASRLQQPVGESSEDAYQLMSHQAKQQANLSQQLPQEASQLHLVASSTQSPQALQQTHQTPDQIQQVLAPIQRAVAVGASGPLQQSSQQITLQTPSCVHEMMAPIQDAQKAIDLLKSSSVKLASHGPPQPPRRSRYAESDVEAMMSGSGLTPGGGGTPLIQQSTSVKDLFPTLGTSGNNGKAAGSSGDESTKSAIKNLEKTISAIKTLSAAEQSEKMAQLQKEIGIAATFSNNQVSVPTMQTPTMVTDSQTFLSSQSGTKIRILDNMPSENDSLLNSVLKIQAQNNPSLLQAYQAALTPQQQLQQQQQQPQLTYVSPQQVRTTQNIAPEQKALEQSSAQASSQHFMSTSAPQPQPQPTTSNPNPNSNVPAQPQPQQNLISPIISYGQPSEHSDLEQQQQQKIEHLKKQIDDLKRSQQKQAFQKKATFMPDSMSQIFEPSSDSRLQQRQAAFAKKATFMPDSMSQIFDPPSTSMVHIQIPPHIKSQESLQEGQSSDFNQYRGIIDSSNQAMTERNSSAQRLNLGTFTSSSQKLASGSQTTTERDKKRQFRENKIMKTLAAIDFLDKNQKSLSRVIEEEKDSNTQYDISLSYIKDPNTTTNRDADDVIEEKPESRNKVHREKVKGGKSVKSSILKSQSSIDKVTRKSLAASVKFDINGKIEKARKSFAKEDEHEYSGSSDGEESEIPLPAKKLLRKKSTVSDPRYSIGTFKSMPKTGVVNARQRKNTFADKRSKLKDTFALKEVAKKRESIKSMPPDHLKRKKNSKKQLTIGQEESEAQLSSGQFEETQEDPSAEEVSSVSQSSDEDSDSSMNLPSNSDEFLQSQSSITEEEYEEEVEEEISDPDQNQTSKDNSADSIKDDDGAGSQNSGKSKMTQLREAIVKDSTKAVVPDQFHHLFMDESESEKTKKSKKGPVKRIKTIVVKKKASVKRANNESDAEEKMSDFEKATKYQQKKYRKLQSQRTQLLKEQKKKKKL